MYHFCFRGLENQNQSAAETMKSQINIENLSVFYFPHSISDTSLVP